VTAMIRRPIGLDSRAIRLAVAAAMMLAPLPGGPAAKGADKDKNPGGFSDGRRGDIPADGDR